MRCPCHQCHEGAKRDLSEVVSKAAGTNATFSVTETSGANLEKEVAYQGVGSFHHKLRKEEWVEQESRDIALVGCIRRFWEMGSRWRMVSKIKTLLELSRKKK